MMSALSVGWCLAGAGDTHRYVYTCLNIVLVYACKYTVHEQNSSNLTNSDKNTQLKHLVRKKDTATNKLCEEK